MIRVKSSLHLKPTYSADVAAHMMSGYLNGMFHDAMRDAGRATMVRAFMLLVASHWEQLQDADKQAMWQRAIAFATRNPSAVIMSHINAFLADKAPEVLALMMAHVDVQKAMSHAILTRRCIQYMQAPFFSDDVRALSNKAAKQLVTAQSHSRHDSLDAPRYCIFNPLPQETFAQHLFAYRDSLREQKSKQTTIGKTSAGMQPSPLRVAHAMASPVAVCMAQTQRLKGSACPALGTA